MRRDLIASMKLAALAVAAVLAGCASGPPPQRPGITLPAAYDGQAASASAVLASDWWKHYNEPALNALVEQGLANNLDLRLAAARVDEAAVAVALARSAQWPSFELNTGITRSRASLVAGQPIQQAETTLHRVSIGTSFEIDLWGRLRNATEGARDQLLATQYGRDTVRLALVGAVVQNWFGVRALDAQQTAVAAQLKARGDSLLLVRRRVEGGVASGLEQAQAEAALAALAAQQHELARQRELLVHQLGALTVQPGLRIPAEMAVLPTPAAIPPGLPSELLQRRPDIQQAEATMRASFSQFEFTKKSAWPILSLTGSFGSQSADLADLLRSSARVWSIGPSLLVSLFDAGRNEARTDEARAQAQQAAIGWQQATQTAFREVADALSSHRLLAAQEAELEIQRRSALDAQRLSTRRYEAGYSGYLEVLDAQRSAQDAELALLRTRQARLDAHVALQKALGGGWQAPPP